MRRTTSGLAPSKPSVGLLGLLQNLLQGLFLGMLLGLSSISTAAIAQESASPRNGEAIYIAAKPKLLQIRSLVKASGNQSSIGSGFLVLDGTLAVTNYHVVSQLALEPDSYRLEYLGTNGEKGNLRLIAIDAAHDLAVVALDRRLGTGMSFAQRDLPKGERAWSLGNPLDLGFTIVEGVYNGPVETSYGERLHFVGAINAGMSGGPVVDLNGQVIGVNVAKLLRGELTSFLVPRQFAQTLLSGLGDTATGLGTKALSSIDSNKVRDIIAGQLLGLDTRLSAELAAAPVKKSKLGSYQISEPEKIWNRCWSRTNAEVKPQPRFKSESSQCNIDSGVFLAGDLEAGGISYTHTSYESRDLNAYQFARLLERNFQQEPISGAFGKNLTPGRCQTQYVKQGEGTVGELVLLVRTCARAYRDFPGVYDFGITMVTQDQGRRALLSSFIAKAMSWNNGRQLIQNFMRSAQIAL